MRKIMTKKEQDRKEMAHVHKKDKDIMREWKAGGRARGRETEQEREREKERKKKNIWM